MKSNKHNLKRVRRFLEEIEWMFELNNFSRYIIDKPNQPEEFQTLTAEVTIDKTYKELTINLYPTFWELSLELQRKALLHELTHTVLSDSKKLATDLVNGFAHNTEEIRLVNESTTSLITGYLDMLLRNNLRYARKAYKNYLKIK